MQIRERQTADEMWIGSVLDENWAADGTGIIIVHGESFDARTLPALIAGEREGLATYKISPETLSAELITLDAFKPHQGVGGALVDALVDKMRQQGVSLLRVTTTNDNLDALRFFQRRGFCIVPCDPAPLMNRAKANRRLQSSGNMAFPYGTRSN